MTKIGIIILAAGASKRFGAAKQLAEFNGNTLIKKAVQTAIAVDPAEICIVLGANFEIIKKEIEDFPVKIIYNPNWPEGMSSSLKTGLKYFIAKNFSAALVMLCDQPLVKSAHLNELIEKFAETGKPLIVSKYQDAEGVPAIFSGEIFSQLLKIEGDKGARTVIEENSELAEFVEIPEAGADIDTKKDLRKISGSWRVDD